MTRSNEIHLTDLDAARLERSLIEQLRQSPEPAQGTAELEALLDAAAVVPSATIDPAVVTELATALSSFVTEPKVLTISLAPKAPIKAQAFVDAASDPAKVLTKETLGFSAGNK
jgi:hypothetical protein